MKKSCMMGMLVFLASLAAVRMTLKKDYRAHNNPEFDKKLHNISATLVGKQFTGTDAELYFDTDDNPETIEVLMRIPVVTERQQVELFSVKNGTKHSLLDWKKSFMPPQDSSFYPYVRTFLFDNDK